jgi:Tfp pilus assembly protein PilO
MPANSAVTRSRRVLIGSSYAALATVFLIGGAYFFRGAAKTRAAIAGFRKEIAQRRQTQSTLDRVNRDIQEINVQVRDYPRLVPENQDLGSFLETLSKLLNESGMKDVDVRNQKPIALEKSQKLPIPLRASGTFAEFHDFLVKLENLPRMCSVGRITIESADQEMTGKVNIDLTLYIYNSKPG